MVLRCAIIFPLFWFLLTGCGGTQGVDMGGPDGKLVAEVVENLNDNTNNAAKLARVFAKGSGPAAGKKYGGLAYYVVGKPVVTGDQATCKVRVEKAADGTTVGELEWSFVKEGSDWKIKSAPIP